MLRVMFRTAVFDPASYEDTACVVRGLLSVGSRITGLARQDGGRGFPEKFGQRITRGGGAQEGRGRGQWRRG